MSKQVPTLPADGRDRDQETSAWTALAEQRIRSGDIAGAEVILNAAPTDDSDRTTLCWASIAVERGELERASTLVAGLDQPDAANARLAASELAVRGRNYDDHYDLVFAVVRSHHLDNSQLGTLALQTGELAVLTANLPLAANLFDNAATLLNDDPLGQARAGVGRRIAGAVDAPPQPTDTPDAGPDGGLDAGPDGGLDDGESPDHVLTAAADLVARFTACRPLGVGAAHSFEPAAGDGDIVERLRDGGRRLTESGLADLGHRLDILSAALSSSRPVPGISPDDLAHCPWVTTDLLYARFEQCRDVDFDYWAQTLEQRAASCPHSSLVVETSDVVHWARSIHDQHQQNLALDRAIEQTRSGWRELANLTSNEIRGLLTSLGVAADLRRAGSATPSGLELALVHRIAALTTMTQLGATEAPSEVERPTETGSHAAALLDDVVAGERPIFEWAQRSLEVDNRVGDDVTIHVNPAAMSDMLRWLLLSATTGSLSESSIKILATTATVESTAGPAGGGHQVLSIEILSRTPEPPKPERHRELGLGSETTAHRAAVMLVQSWNGTFSAAYTPAGLDIKIELPARTRR